MSDISGQDIHAHNGETSILISELAAWLRAETRDTKIPGGRAINIEFSKFKMELPLLLKAVKLSKDEATYLDYRKLAQNWILGNQR